MEECQAQIFLTTRFFVLELDESGSATASGVCRGVNCPMDFGRQDRATRSANWTDHPMVTNGRVTFVGRAR